MATKPSGKKKTTSLRAGKIELSVVYPTYNERENIGPMITNAMNYFASRGIRGEVIVVDDQSPDGTGKVVAEMQKKYPSLILITPAVKKGIGAALAEGYAAARGECILSMDVDIEFADADIDRIRGKMSQFDMVVASKYHAGSKLFRNSLKERVQGIVSQCGNAYIAWLTGIPIRDFSMNFRIMRKEVWAQLHPTDTKNFFLAECIYQAAAAGYRIGDTHFTFTPRKYGTSKTELWNQAVVFFTRSWAYRRWFR